MTQGTNDSASDGYYGDDELNTDDELDLSFLDQSDDDDKDVEKTDTAGSDKSPRP